MSMNSNPNLVRDKEIEMLITVSISVKNAVETIYSNQFNFPWTMILPVTYLMNYFKI